MRMCSLRGQIPAQEGRTPYKPLGQNDHSGHIQPHVRSQSPVTQGLRGRGLKPHTIREAGVETRQSGAPPERRGRLPESGWRALCLAFATGGSFC